jgi:hypothetical protein
MPTLRNALGITEAAWNAWRAEQAAYEAATEPRHKAHEVCDCTDIPPVPVRESERPLRGHCAARGPIVEWKPATV